MVRTRGGFRMERDAMGLSQTDVAQGCHVTRRTVQYWERDGKPPETAWTWLAGMRVQFDSMVEAAVSALDSAPGAKTVSVAYYRSQKEHDVHGRGPAPYGMVNAATREAARIARERGFQVEAFFPEEHDPALDAAKESTRD